MRVFIVLLYLSLMVQWANAQGYKAEIEPTACPLKIGTGVIAKCGYLVVPENRQKPNGRKIKVPFVFARKADADSTQNVSLYTTGGPGYSTISYISEINATSGFLKFGGFIAFDQRGTKKSIPALESPEIEEAIQRSYRENLNKDSLVLVATQQMRQRLSDQGIDLSAYNTVESAADINDLRTVLHIKQLNLVGISYSGGLMLTVARLYPEMVRTLILNSPLPSYVTYEEHGLFNMNEALDQIFANCDADSTNKALYGNLKKRFQDYFTSITNKHFTISYQEKGSNEKRTITYGKAELLDAIFARMSNGQLKDLPFIIYEMTNGRHEPYVKEVLDEVFAGNPGYTLGMRYSVYCSEQIAFANPQLVKQQEKDLPWFAGYPFNNVNQAICDCWKVKPAPLYMKEALYSKIPVLASAGDADPFCRPFYNRIIKKTMPNAQLLIVHNRGHGAGFGNANSDFLGQFLKNPYQKLVSNDPNIKVE
ncbi:alpha/beta fold hydrolase [Pedobacter sp. KR3-3]|uniref:Alpha/beta fold hydrolase n=1 Tax=Pedobacter albus TaxID=3113905 RepID=A0ABU7I3P7_9SPHI|nr:alpha/beta fold hydrolase [Pedobacter sp. KR3-3]MEE1943986.1 alpha/beta fold hydrolase [Pedobacter sp. KR3-3]